MWAHFNEISCSILGGTVLKVNIKPSSSIACSCLMLWKTKFPFYTSMLIQIVAKLKVHFVQKKGSACWHRTRVLKGTDSQLKMVWKQRSDFSVLSAWTLTSFYLGEFTKLRKTAITFVMSCLSVRTFVRPHWRKKNSAPTGRIFMKFYFWGFFEKLSRKFKFN